MKTLLFSTIAAIIALISYASYEANQTELTLPFAPQTKIGKSEILHGISAVHVDGDYSAVSYTQARSWMGEISELTETISYMSHTYSVTVNIPSKGIHNVKLPISKLLYELLYNYDRPYELHFYYLEPTQHLGIHWCIRTND